MTTFWYFIEFVMCAIETGLIFTLYYKALGLHERFTVHIYTLAALVYTIGLWVATCINPYSVWKTVCGLLLLLAVAVLFMAGKFIHKLVYFLLAIGLTTIADILATTFVAWVKNAVTWEIVLSPTTDRLAIYAIAKIIMCIVIALLIHRKLDLASTVPSRYWLLFLMSFSLMLICILALIDVGLPVENNERFNTIIICIILVMLVFYLMVYFFYYRICSFFADRNERNLLEYQNELIEKYVLQKQESDKMIRIMNHDLKHHLLSWKVLLEDQGYQEALANVLEFEKTIADHKMIDVENDVANTLLNQKFHAARERNIQFLVQGVFHKDISISQIDFFALLGNLLDNAIEAAEKVDRSDIRFARMFIKRNGRFLILEIENSYAEEPVMRNGVLVTQKKNRTMHGVGMLSINHVLSKYMGNMIQTYEKGIFKAMVGLRVYGDSIQPK